MQRFFNGLRADGLSHWNVNVLRELKITERVRLQFRGDATNLQNRSQMNPPDFVADVGQFWKGSQARRRP